MQKLKILWFGVTKMYNRFAAVVLFLCSSISYACDCDSSGFIDSVDEAKRIVVVIINSKKMVSDEEYKYIGTVDKILKGKSSSKVSFVEETDSIACGDEYDKGNSYIFFGDEQLWTSSCSIKFAANDKNIKKVQNQIIANKKLPILKSRVNKYKQQKNYSQIIKEISAYFKSAETNDGLLISLASAFAKQGKLTSAISTLNKITDKYGNAYSTKLYNLACYYSLKKDKFNSIQKFDELLNKIKDYPKKTIYYIEMSKTDSDLSNIRKDSAYQYLVKKYTTKLKN